MVLATLIIAAYWPVLGADFLSYDDSKYVTGNRHVLGGLTFENFKWAFSIDGYAANWHPLTWLSHMLDCELFGQNASLHHLTNLIIHTVSAILLLLVLVSMTGEIWPSAFVAAAFALHPLHVESVAWIAERKDVLSGLFWMLTMACYLRYARIGGRINYNLTLVVFGFGLMAKPMLVTLPFVLLLLDYWPLKRFEFNPAVSCFRTMRPFVVEKVPFIVLSGTSCIVTFMVQKAGGAVSTIEFISFWDRVSNAAVSYVNYIFMMVCPVGLAVLYPIKHIPLWQSFSALLLLAIITAGVVLLVRKQRYFAIGWFWYLGTLVPVIGLVQVGVQSHADRYTYIPLIGLFLIAAWNVANLCRKQQALRIVSSVVFMLLLVGMFAGTRKQLGYWTDSIALSRRAIQVTKNNYTMHNSLGVALAKTGQLDEAIDHYRRALQIAPNYDTGYNNLGLTLAKAGQLDEAISAYRRALQIAPDYVDAHINLAAVLAERNHLDEAIDHYRRVLQIDPDNTIAQNNLGPALAKAGQLDQVISQSRDALKIDPDNAIAHNNLGFALAKAGQLDEGISHYRDALKIDPDYAEAHINLAAALEERNQLDEAIAHYLQALKLPPEHPVAMNNLAWILATAADPALREPEEAVRLAEKVRDLMSRESAWNLDTLSTAYASAERFNEAISTAERALKLAEEAGDEDLAQNIENRLKLFKAGQSYFEKPLIKDNIPE